jgi:hypothetical protein
MIEEYKGCPSKWLHSIRIANTHLEQDARLLEIKGKLKGQPTNLLVNFLTRGREISPWIWNGKTRSTIQIPVRPYGNNSLARVLELCVLAATGLPVNCIGFDASLFCHQELLRVHSKLLDNDIRRDVEFKIGKEFVGRAIALDGGDS